VIVTKEPEARAETNIIPEREADGGENEAEICGNMKGIATSKMDKNIPSKGF
jgi:hypothetical protein